MIYDKLLSLYILQTGRFENDIITATNNVFKTDFSNQSLIELIQIKTIAEWYGEYFKDILDYVKTLEID